MRARTLALALITPLLEKNVIKTLSLDMPVVFSMSRVIVLAFAIGMLHQLWHAGIAGWPDATLAIAIVLAIPILSAMERLKPAEVADLTKTLMSRFGIGASRSITSLYAEEPSKYDDHRNDSV